MDRPTTASRMGRLGLLAAALCALLAAPGSAGAQSPAPVGYDISYPLCGMPFPAGQAFGIVGVNAGLANNANPCLPAELTWAAASAGLASPAVPPVALYVNAADPGNGVADWPSPANGTATPPTPYGSCDGSWSTACGYLYGVERAAADYQLVAVTGGPLSPATSAWWLDIETLSSWATPARQASWATLNTATIGGFIAGLRASGAGGRIGFYSTPIQWLRITGLTTQTSPQQFPTTAPDWVAGVGTLADAQANCAKSFSGAAVVLAQYAAGGLDADYPCPPARSAPAPVAPGLRIASHALTRTRLTLTGRVATTYRGHVEVELDETYRGASVRVRRSAATVFGSWSATIPLPNRYRGLVSTATAQATTRAQDGLTAGLARLLIHVHG
ncbi:MAG TPA: hypothetical protein VG165_16305 [Solirubrobacteraceae bacterium]|nr:hypothetical protein [Solirubrobacteraceae bacterium]